MITTTNILDVLPDGAITRLSFTVSSVLSIMLCRTNVDKPFVIEKFDAATDDEKLLTEAVEAVRDLMMEQGIDIEIPIADPTSATFGLTSAT